MATIDLEGAEALRELKLFEKNKCKKQPNRYAKAHLEAYLTRDETMGARIKTRTQLTQAKMESNMRSSVYSQKRLAKGFKTYNSQLMRSGGGRLDTGTSQEGSLERPSVKNVVLETANSRITPLGLEIPKR